MVDLVIPESEEQVFTVFKPLAEMQPDERKIIDRANEILMCDGPTQKTVQSAALYLANQHKRLIDLFVPQTEDYDHYLAQKYALENVLLCILFEVHKSHDLSVFLKRKKNLEDIKELFYKQIEKKITKWANVYAAIRNTKDRDYFSILAILYQMCVLRLNRLFVRDKMYWNKLLEEVQRKLDKEQQEIEIKELCVSELGKRAINFSRANEFLIEMRIKCLELIQMPPGKRFTFQQLHSAVQLRWIVGKWSRTIMINDIILVYQDVFDENLWQTFKETTVYNRSELKRAIRTYKQSIAAKYALVFKENRGQYYTIIKRRFLLAFEDTQETDPVFREYLELLSNFVEGEKNAPSPFSKITRALKERKEAIRFTNYIITRVVRRVPIPFNDLLGGKCVCPSVPSAAFGYYFAFIYFKAEPGSPVAEGEDTIFPSKENEILDWYVLLIANIILKMGVTMCLAALFVASKRYVHRHYCRGKIVRKYRF